MIEFGVQEIGRILFAPESIQVHARECHFSSRAGRLNGRPIYPLPKEATVLIAQLIPTKDELLANLTPLLGKPHSFQTWLEQSSREQEVGFAGDPFACPVATWLVATGFSPVGV